MCDMWWGQKLECDVWKAPKSSWFANFWKTKLLKEELKAYVNPLKRTRTSMFFYLWTRSENIPCVPIVFSSIQVPKIFVQFLASKHPSRPPFCLWDSTQSPFICGWYGYQASRKERMAAKIPTISNTHPSCFLEPKLTKLRVICFVSKSSSSQVVWTRRPQSSGRTQAKNLDRLVQVAREMHHAELNYREMLLP